MSDALWHHCDITLLLLLQAGWLMSQEVTQPPSSSVAPLFWPARLSSPPLLWFAAAAEICLVNTSPSPTASLTNQTALARIKTVRTSPLSWSGGSQSFTDAKEKACAAVKSSGDDNLKSTRGDSQLLPVKWNLALVTWPQQDCKEDSDSSTQANTETYKPRIKLGCMESD